MILLINPPRFHRRFTPRRAADSIPVQPLIHVMLYWCCTTFGGLFASVGIVAFLANQIEGIVFERSEILLMVTLAALSPLLFTIAYRSWRKLNH